jgi:hypothetical protein
MIKTDKISTADEQFAVVTFLRPGSGLTSFVSGDKPSEIWDSEHLIGVLSSDQTVQYKATPGKHVFIGHAANWSFIEADLEAGKYYYVFIKTAPGRLPFQGSVMNVILIPVNKESPWHEKTNQWNKMCIRMTAIEDKFKAYEKKKSGAVLNAIKNYKQGKADVLFIDKADYLH